MTTINRSVFVLGCDHGKEVPAEVLRAAPDLIGLGIPGAFHTVYMRLWWWVPETRMVQHSTGFWYYALIHSDIDEVVQAMRRLQEP